MLNKSNGIFNELKIKLNKTYKSRMSQSSVSRVNGWCQLSVSSLWTFSRNGATRPPICHSDVLQVWYTYLQNQIDLYMSTLWISDHHAPPNLKTVHSAGILQQAWMCVLHHKTTKFRSNASVHLCPASFCKFVKPFLRFIFCITRYFHYCSTVLSIYAPLYAVHLRLLNYVIKNTKFRTGAETVPIFWFYLGWDRKQKPDTADCCDIYVHIFTLFMNTNQQCQSLWKVMRTMPISTMAKI